MGLSPVTHGEICQGEAGGRGRGLLALLMKKCWDLNHMSLYISAAFIHTQTCMHAHLHVYMDTVCIWIQCVHAYTFAHTYNLFSNVFYLFIGGKIDLL